MIRYGLAGRGGRGERRRGLRVMAGHVWKVGGARVDRWRVGGSAHVECLLSQLTGYLLGVMFRHASRKRWPLLVLVRWAVPLQLSLRNASVAEAMESGASGTIDHGL